MIKLSIIESATATGVLTSNNTNVSVDDTVTIGTRTYTFKDLYATATITSNNTNPAADTTVSIGARVYTFKTALTEDGLHAGEVVIGADANATLLNLKDAVNADETAAGTTFDSATLVHEYVTAGAVEGTGHTVTFTANTAGGGVQNDITVASTTVTLSWGEDVTTFGGAYEIVNDEVGIGATADASLTNLKNAINGVGGYIANTQVTSSAVASHALTLTAITSGAGANTIATTEEAVTLSFAAATLGGGIGGEMSSYTLDTTGAKYTYPVSVSVYKELIAFLTVHSHTGSSGTLDVKFQMSPDGTNWVDSDAFTQVTTTDSTTYKRLTTVFGDYLRAVVTPGGTPDYTVSLSLSGK